MRQQKGFTLIEMMVGITISTLLGLMLIHSFLTNNRVIETQREVSALQESIITTQRSITRTLRFADGISVGSDASTLYVDVPGGIGMRDCSGEFISSGVTLRFKHDSTSKTLVCINPDDSEVLFSNYVDSLGFEYGFIDHEGVWTTQLDPQASNATRALLTVGGDLMTEPMSLIMTSATRPVEQSPPTFMEIVIDTRLDPDSNRFELPVRYGNTWHSDNIFNSSDVMIDWNVGGESVSPHCPLLWNKHEAVSCDYPEEGEYVIRIYGHLSSYSRNPWSGVKPPQPMITRVNTFGDHPIISLEYAFNKAVNLSYIPSYIPTSVRRLHNTFSEIPDFNLSNIRNWNVGNVQIFSGMFRNSFNFNQDIGNWDTSSATHMSGLFERNHVFNQNLSRWNVSNVERMDHMFLQNWEFNQPFEYWDEEEERMVHWDTSSLTYAHRMFSGARNFNQPVNFFNMDNLGSAGYMFEGAHSFNQPIDNWNFINTAIRGMFSGARSFNQPVNHFITDELTSLEFVFNGAYSFNQPLDNWNTSNVTNMRRTFRTAASFNQDISMWDTSNVTNMFEIFRDAFEFNQDISNWNVGNVENFYYAFGRGHISNGLENQILNHVDSDLLVKFNQNIGNWDMSSAKDIRGMFINNRVFNNGGYESINNWNTSNVNYLDSVFSGAINFNQPLNNWDTSNVTSFRNTFRTASSFNQPLDMWDTSKGTNFMEMFRRTRLFNQPLNTWDMSNATNLDSMLEGARDFNQSLSNWDVSNVTIMRRLFQRTSMNYNLNCWNVLNVLNRDNFSSLSSMESSNEPIWGTTGTGTCN